MKNKGNSKKGWLISLVVLLVLFNDISNVKALENEYLEETNLTEIKKEVIEEEIIVEDTNKEEITDEEFIEEQTKEEIFTANSKNLEFKNNQVVVKGNVNELITVGELLDNINIIELTNKYFIEKITVTNEEDIVLDSVDYITNKCHLIIISNEYIANYKIIFLVDLNQDNLINDKDIEIGVEDFFKEETIIEEEITITEKVSYIDAVIKNNSYEVEIPIQEEITVNLESTDTEEKYIDSNIIVELSIEGLINNYINTISGNIEYNDEILELESIYITVDNKVIGKYIDNKFIYVLDNYHDNKPLLLIIFKSIKEGTTSISINDLKISMNGTLININNNTNLNITVLKPGKGGDVEMPSIDTPESIPSKPLTKPITITNNNSIKLSQTTINETPKLSNDNYIKNIGIDNYEINFNKDKNYYSINVDNNTNSLNLNITLNNEFANYEIIGNENFIPGKNEVIIAVTSQNNETRNYIIEVNKDNIKKESNLKEQPNQNTHIIILVTLIITIIILIYKLLRKED